jgi:hypothetical protein
VPWEGGAAPAKVCTDCGIDVSGQRRTKDTAGRYYCQPCWAAKVQAGAATALSRQPAVAAAPVLAAAHDPFSTQDVLPLPEPSPAHESDDLQTLEECADCGLSVPAGELVPDHEDRMICTSCARKDVALAPPPLPAPAYAPPAVRPAQALPYQTPPPAKSRRAAGSSGGNVAQMLIGGAICVVGIVVTVGTYFAAVAGGGGRYTIAWGAIVFGAWRFFKGLSGVLDNR